MKKCSLKHRQNFKENATFWMLLRGVIFVIPSFILLPMALGDKGLWLAMPLSEMLTFGVILLSLLGDRRIG